MRITSTIHPRGTSGKFVVSGWAQGFVSRRVVDLFCGYVFALFAGLFVLCL